MERVQVLLLAGGAPYHDQPEHREILSNLLLLMILRRATVSPIQAVSVIEQEE